MRSHGICFCSLAAAGQVARAWATGWLYGAGFMQHGCTFRSHCAHPKAQNSQACDMPLGSKEPQE